ncbi:hypothetical protein SprV_0702359300 [Sparganum proliferum]
MEKEALAPVFGVKNFRKLLYVRCFTLSADHKSSPSISHSKMGIPVYLDGRLQRWATVLLDYDFVIRYYRTTDFGQAKALFRLICNHRKPEEDIAIATISIEGDVRRQLSGAIRGIPVAAAEIQRATGQDLVLRQAITDVPTYWPITTLAGEIRQPFLLRASLSVIDACFMFADRVVVPSSLQLTVPRHFHSVNPGTSQMNSIARSFDNCQGSDNGIGELV